MPSLPPRVCSCGRIVASGSRCPCQAARKAEHDRRRPTAHQRGYTSKWQRESKAFLLAHPHCGRCGGTATLVHHIVAHKGDQKLFWRRSNWLACCKRCHDSHFQSQERR